MTIQGQQVFYKLYVDTRTETYHFKTVELTLRYPSFQTSRQHGIWQFGGLEDPSIREQALAEIEVATHRQEGPIL
jgi:hypothetical protein